MLDQWEPGELRGSRRVLRATEGEVPSVDSPVVFIPKYRKKAIFGQIRRDLGEVLKRLAQQRESQIEEGHLMPDHVHMMISIPPKYAVSQVIGYIKGKSAIHIARRYSAYSTDTCHPFHVKPATHST